VGKLAINQFLRFDKLTEVIGQRFSWQGAGYRTELIPLPHPSGASTWHRTEPGKSLLHRALEQISRHPAWRDLLSL
jgi:uracil-DNA glycosylase